MISPRTRSTLERTVTGALLAVGLLLVAVPTALAAPAWDIHISHNPAVFHRGELKSEVAHDVYQVAVTNTGDVRTTGPITITDTLPAGLTIAPPTFLDQSSGSAEFNECTGDGKTPIEGASVLSCSMTSERMDPGETRSITVLVSVSESAPNLVVNKATVSGGGAAASASAEDPTTIGDKIPYEINSFTSPTTDESGGDYTAAGGHPYQNRTRFSFSLNDGELPVEYLKDASVDLPYGFFGNPAAAPRCSISDVPSFEFVPGSICPLGSVVGTASVGDRTPFNLYNVKPERGYPAQFAFNYVNVIVSLVAVPRPRTESYGLTIGSTNASRLAGAAQAVVSAFTTVFNGTVPNGTEAPFLTNPVDCSDANPTWRVVADSWEHPGRMTPLGTPDLSDPHWLTKTFPAPPVTGCDDPALTSQFRPAIGTTPLQGGGPVQADQPTGLAVDLDFPQSNDPTDLNTTFEPSRPQAPEPKHITVKLPAGLTVSPSSASGLSGCSDLASDPAGDQVRYDSVKPATCPDASKIGTVTTTTPLLASHDPVTDAVTGAEPIGGNVYLLKPHPGDLVQGQDGTFRLLIEINSPRYGINFKLPGTAVADKNTGQLTTVFTDNPQLPAKHLTVNLKSGPRAPLASPTTCGSFETTSRFVPWGSPAIPDAVPPNAAFNVGSGANGSPCANSPGARPFNPSLSAGTEGDKAGAASPFVMRLARSDGEQELSSLELTTPKGFTAKLAGVPYCSDAAIAAASGTSGASEQASSSCPAASQVGTITAGAGPGASPFYVDGKAYLAGPYKGAPLSLAFITPAVAGPFDLGNVVVRAALAVDPETTQVTVKTDPLPQIIDGVPLRLRSIVARIDRPNFTLNPTNCSPMTVNATITGASGGSAHPSNAFQVGSCGELGFKPDLKLSLKGGTARSGHPALKATLTYPKGNYANIAKAAVSLPHSEFLAQSHIKTICTRVQFAANQCPAASIYGSATATTPLLDQPLSGPVYLRSSSNQLPDLVAALHGQIDVNLVGRIDSKNGGIRTTFDSVPDAPVSQFVLTMLGGKKGLLENSKNLCSSVNKADVKFTAQNGLMANSKPVLSNSCKKGKKRKRGGKPRGHKRIASWTARLGF